LDPFADFEDVPTLIYDGECPVCRSYSTYVQLRQRMGIRLLDARQSPELVSELKQRGYDLNQGMALIWESRVYLGKKALLMLNSLTFAKGVFDLPFRFLLRIPGAAAIIYPVCKFIRWILLRLLGKDPDLHLIK